MRISGSRSGPEFLILSSEVLQIDPDVVGVEKTMPDQYSESSSDPFAGIGKFLLTPGGRLFFWPGGPPWHRMGFFWQTSIMKGILGFRRNNRAGTHPGLPPRLSELETKAYLMPAASSRSSVPDALEGRVDIAVAGRVPFQVRVLPPVGRAQDCLSGFWEICSG